MPQLLFLPLQHWREPPCSLWSQQWTGPPFSSWTQAPSANEHSEILSARTSIKPWRFVWSISQNVLLLSLEPDVWKKILVAVLFTTNTKNQGMTRAITQEVSNVFSFSLAACQSTRIQNISRWQGFFRQSRRKFQMFSPFPWQRVKVPGSKIFHGDKDFFGHKKILVCVPCVWQHAKVPDRLQRLKALYTRFS